jgi:hypothetical protein
MLLQQHAQLLAVSPLGTCSRGLMHSSMLLPQLQLEKLTASFQYVTEDLRRQFMVDGEPLLHESSIGSSPILSSSFRRTTGFSVPEKPSLSSSGVRPPPICSRSL